MGVIVRQKKPGKGKPWWVFVSHQGQRTSKKVGDRKAAEEVASQIRAKLKLGDFSFEEERPVPTFGEYCKTFLAGYSMLNHKESTRQSYREVLGLHILPFFGRMPLNEIGRGLLQQVLEVGEQHHEVRLVIQVPQMAPAISGLRRPCSAFLLLDPRVRFEVGPTDVG